MSMTALVILVVHICACLSWTPALGLPASVEAKLGTSRTPPATTESLMLASNDAPLGDFLFMFAVIGDSHIVGPIKRMGYDFSGRSGLMALNISDQLLANYVNDINSHMPPVDFVFQLGDLTDNGKMKEFAMARAIFDGLGCPLYPVVGNHDNMQSDNKRGWKDFAGRDSTNYTFDHSGFHFIVIDCTIDPYVAPYVHCDSTLRAWVARDLAINYDKPTFVISHFNMWERIWSAHFAIVGGYKEYKGIPDLRDILTAAGNVIAVINGHVHANRVEVHDDIYYIDVSATLIGRPSIRYFYVFPDKVDVTYAYLSDAGLSKRVEDQAHQCHRCFDPTSVSDFIDGSDSDKSFTMLIKTPAPTEANLPNRHR